MIILTLSVLNISFYALVVLIGICTGLYFFLAHYKFRNYAAPPLLEGFLAYKVKLQQNQGQLYMEEINGIITQLQEGNIPAEIKHYRIKQQYSLKFGRVCDRLSVYFVCHETVTGRKPEKRLLKVQKRDQKLTF